MDSASLYDDDILAWSELQAAALRSLTGRHDLPIATLSIEAQERRERRERQYGDRDDRYR